MSASIATRQAYGEILAELGAEDDRIVVLDADLSGSTKTGIFAKKYPDRFFNVGVAEQNLVAISAGMARQGLKPFASTFAVFATGRAFEPIRQQIAYTKLPVRIVASHGGITVGEDGGSHQSVEDLAIMRALPNMTVIVPADATETRMATRAMLAWDGPVYMRTGRMNVPVLFGDDYPFAIGRGYRIREGKAGTIIACGIMVAEALKAADILAGKGIEVRVVNMATLKPIDRQEVVAAARETGWIVTAEEGSIIGGLGSAVAEVVTSEAPCPVVRVGMQDQFGTSGPAELLLEHFKLNADGILTAVEQAARVC